MFNSFRSSLSRFLPARPTRTRLDPDTPFALYFEPSGRVRPITMRSAGMTNGDYNAVNQSMNRSGNAPASELGYAYISEVNVWVRRCVEIRASNIKRLDWYVKDRRTGRRLPDHPMIIAMNRSRHFFQRTERSLLIWGELYLKPLQNEWGYYSDVWWLNNLSVNFNIVNGFIDQFFYAPLHGGKPYKWPTWEMCYIYTENAFDDLRGSSKVLAVLQEANVHEEIARAAQAHFANDARPGIMFLPETDMGVPQSEEFIKFWKDNFQGSWNTNKPVILPTAIKSVVPLPRAELKDDVELRGSIRREICADFGVPLSVAGAWDDANYQSAPAQRVSLYEETIIPEGEQIADDLTRSLLPFYGDPEREQVWFDGKNLLALAEDKQAKAAALNSQLTAGGITLNQYREAMDQEAIPQGNVFYVPNTVTVTPVDKLGSMPAPLSPSPFGGGAPTASQPPALPASTDPVPPPDTKDAPGMSVVLSFANNVDLLSLQQDLKSTFAGQPVEWVAPDMFHLTLVSAPLCDEAALEQLAAYLAAYTTPDLPLNIGSLASFDSLNKHALHFRIRRSADLEAYQEDVYLACQSLGIQTGQYSRPGSWTPHITMGYAAQRVPPVTFQSRLRVSPGEVQISVVREGQYTVIGRAACGQPPTIQAAPDTPPPSASDTPPASDTPLRSTPVTEIDTRLDELDAYEKFVLNRWNKPTRTFEFHALSDGLRSDLVRHVSACTEKGQVKRLFESLRAHMRATDDADVVTPEQAQEWWGDYDRLMKTLGDDWLRDYMREVWRRLEPRLSHETTVDDVSALLEDFHPDLIQQWTGTAEEPGVIAKLFMAGMGAGQAALERKRTNMNPLRAAPVVDWTLVPEDAIRAVEKYVGRLIKGIDKTTLKDVQQTLAQWLESGGTVSDLVEQLTPIFNDPVRAKLIAATESSNAYNRGAAQRWADAGVTQMKFKTVQDSRVCPECAALAGTIGTVEDGWNGVFIPVHGGCRCYASPVL